MTQICGKCTKCWFWSNMEFSLNWDGYSCNIWDYL